LATHVFPALSQRPEFLAREVGKIVFFVPQSAAQQILLMEAEHNSPFFFF
jgi:hypothetical protein